jgi:chromosome segregation ATPase
MLRGMTRSLYRAQLIGLMFLHTGERIMVDVGKTVGGIANVAITAVKIHITGPIGTARDNLMSYVKDFTGNKSGQVDSSKMPSALGNQSSEKKNFNDQLKSLSEKMEKFESDLKDIKDLLEKYISNGENDKVNDDNKNDSQRDLMKTLNKKLNDLNEQQEQIQDLVKKMQQQADRANESKQAQDSRKFDISLDMLKMRIA